MNTSDNAALDRFLIREQIENYIDALNHRDFDRLAATLAEDIHWSAGPPFDLSFQPKAVYVEMLNTVQAYQFGVVFQMGHGITVRELAGNHARACHTLHIVSDQFETIGLYYDILRKESDGVWRFVRRDFRPTYYEKRVAPGEIYRTLPDPGHALLPTT